MKITGCILIIFALAISGCSLFTKKNDMSNSKSMEEMIQESHEQTRKQDSIRLSKLKRDTDTLNKSLKDLNDFIDSVKNKNK